MPPTSVDTDAEIESLIQAETWDRARALILTELDRNPDDHFLLSRLALTHYEQYEYETALEYEKQALELAPRCPMALFGFAGTLDMLSRDEEAITIYRRLVRRRVNALAYGPCGEGLARARGLISDCYFRMGLCYQQLGDRERAVRMYHRALKERGPGCQSIYPIEEVREALRDIQRENNEHR